MNDLPNRIGELWDARTAPNDCVIKNIDYEEYAGYFEGNDFREFYQELKHSEYIKSQACLHYLNDIGVAYFIASYALYAICLVDDGGSSNFMQDEALSHFISIVCSKRWRKIVPLFSGAEIACLNEVIELLVKHSEDLYIEEEVGRLNNACSGMVSKQS